MIKLVIVVSFKIFNGCSILSVWNQLASQNSALGAEAVGKLITRRKTGHPQNSQPTVQFQCRIRQKCMELCISFTEPEGSSQC